MRKLPEILISTRDMKTQIRPRSPTFFRNRPYFTKKHSGSLCTLISPTTIVCQYISALPRPLSVSSIYISYHFNTTKVLHPSRLGRPIILLRSYQSAPQAHQEIWDIALGDLQGSKDEDSLSTFSIPTLKQCFITLPLLPPSKHHPNQSKVPIKSTFPHSSNSKKSPGNSKSHSASTPPLPVSVSVAAATLLFSS